MADIFDILISILCPTSGSASYCRDFVNASHHQTLAPLGPLFYFLLFPAVFIILFVYWLSGRVIKEHKGINLLVGITIFIFIIISGWYPVALWISEVWYIFVIILIGLFVLGNKFWDALTGGGGTTAMPSFGRQPQGEIEKRIRKKLTKTAIKALRLETDEEKEVNKVKEKLKKHGWDSLSRHEQNLIEDVLKMSEGMDLEKRSLLESIRRAEKEEK